MLDEAEGVGSMYQEARDTVREVLAPGLTLRHLLRHGRRIGNKLRVRQARRPRQLSRLRGFFRRSVG